MCQVSEVDCAQIFFVERTATCCLASCCSHQFECVLETATLFSNISESVVEHVEFSA
jgi:hypothetical protein